MKKTRTSTLIFAAIIFGMVNLCVFPGAKIFAAPADSQPPKKIMTQEKTELDRLEKLADERIKEAFALRITEKAITIIDKFGFKVNPDEKMVSAQEMFSVSGLDIRRYKEEKTGYAGATISIRDGMKEVFRAVPTLRTNLYEIKIYRPSEWLQLLEKTYKDAELKEIREKIKELKDNFSL